MHQYGANRLLTVEEHNLLRVWELSADDGYEPLSQYQEKDDVGRVHSIVRWDGKLYTGHASGAIKKWK